MGFPFFFNKNDKTTLTVMFKLTLANIIPLLENGIRSEYFSHMWRTTTKYCIMIIRLTV